MSESGRVVALLAFAMFAVVAAVSAQTAKKGVEGVHREAKTDVILPPGTNVDVVRIVRILFEPNVAIVPHAHPMPTISYVLEGEAVLQMECGPVRQVRAGDSFFMPAGVPIVQLDTDTQPLRFVAIFLRRTGDIEDDDPGMTILYPKASGNTDRDGRPCPKT